MSIKYINDAAQKLQNIMKKETNNYDHVHRTKMDLNKWPWNVEGQHNMEYIISTDMFCESIFSIIWNIILLLLITSPSFCY